MLSLFDGVRDMTLFSVILRMLLAVICGGLIGLEREYKRRTAGFRTHILICLGAAMTTLTSQYLFLCMGYFTDIGRLGSQVVAGIGFIGAGTIIVTRRRRIRGLTTAAGMWICAILGLALGAGFYEAAILATGLVLMAEILFVKLEYRLLRKTRENIFYIEFTDKECLSAVLQTLQDNNIKVLNVEMTRAEETVPNAIAIIYVRLSRHEDINLIISGISSVKGVLYIERL